MRRVTHLKYLETSIDNEGRKETDDREIIMGRLETLEEMQRSGVRQTDGTGTEWGESPKQCSGQ